MDQTIEIPDYLGMIQDKKLRKNILKLWDDLGCRFYEMPASTKYHHNSKCGLYQHTKEVIQVACQLHDSFETFRNQGIKLDDAILIAFAHDLDKIYKYVPNTKNWPKNQEFVWNTKHVDCNDTADVVNTLGRYGIHLNAKQLNSLTFSHGGFSVDRGKMTPLATLIHCADILSLAFEEGKKK